MSKERYQNPVIGDTVNLRLFSYNANVRANFHHIVKVEVYFLDPDEKTEANPDGRMLVKTVDGTDVTNVEEGQYNASIVVERDLFSIGQYLDIWTVSVNETDPDQVIAPNYFTVYPSLWFTNTSPIIYDFNFALRPNKIRKGSKRFLSIEITPNVPNQSDLERYYTNLAVVSPLTLSMEQACGDCVPKESDLRIILDKEPVLLREKTYGYYLLDTTDLDCGVYNVWFEMLLGESYYVSDKQQIQIF